MGWQLLSPLHRVVLTSHTLPVPQFVPHERAPPQPSPTTPQYLKSVPLSQVLGTQVVHWLFTQALPLSQLPQSWVTPAVQPSAILPHSAPAIAQAGIATGTLHGQLSNPPHPSDRVPQLVVG